MSYRLSKGQREVHWLGSPLRSNDHKSSELLLATDSKWILVWHLQAQSRARVFVAIPVFGRRLNVDVERP
jgi:hypothetical protein